MGAYSNFNPMFKHRLRYLFIALLAGYSYLNILFTEGSRIFSTRPTQLVLFVSILLLVLLVWEGNRLIGSIALFEKRKAPHPLIIRFVVSVVFIFVLSLVASLTSVQLLANQDFSLTLKLVIGFTFRINLFLHCINTIVYFIDKSKNAELEAEKLKKKEAEYRFTALRNQIDPHFLFNNFNVLTSLVKSKPEVATEFIDQLSDVYRYLLYTQENQVVKLAQEIDFVKSYLYLLRIRFNDRLQVDFKIEPSQLNNYIAPASLQLLIENAVKHNVLTKKNPLHISVYVEGDYLIVENEIRPKDEREPSSKVGLKNIKDRYLVLSPDHPVKVEQNKLFRVSIPIING